jgi:hypothetical protein
LATRFGQSSPVSEGIKQIIRLMATGLPVGGQIREVCPQCHGGSTGERSLSITREAHGLRWNCYRASCDLRPGSTIEMGELLQPAKVADKPLKPYTGRLDPLEDRDTEFFLQRFGIPQSTASHYVRVTGRDEYAFDIDNPREMTRGYVIRQPVWKGLPAPPRDGCGILGYPKALTRMHASGPTQGWFNATSEEQPGTIVLVEDQVSALRAAVAGVRAVALLGTYMDGEKVREIAQQKPREVIIALDADATEQAFGLARRWGLAFRSTRVAMLPCDIKDMASDDEILTALGV